MSKDETALEASIQAKGLNRPRLKPADIDAVIVSETFTLLPSGKVMVCELILRNGFSVRGEGSVVSKENFNEEIGREVSRRNAREKIWELEGYLLQQRLFESTFQVPIVSRQPQHVCGLQGFGHLDDVCPACHAQATHTAG